MGEREELLQAIRTYCNSQSPAAVQMSHGVERIYYAGLPLEGLADAVLGSIRPAQSSWQPIGMAPKDGTEVLCFVEGFGMGQMVLYWMDGYWREKANCLGLKKEPTFWQHTPTPPITSTDGKGGAR